MTTCSTTNKQAEHAEQAEQAKHKGTLSLQKLIRMVLLRPHR